MLKVCPGLQAYSTKWFMETVPHSSSLLLSAIIKTFATADIHRIDGRSDQFSPWKHLPAHALATGQQEWEQEQEMLTHLQFIAFIELSA